MLYHPPYGSTDPDAPYVDRNTPGAVSGSRVPAAAIEDPQREIVDVITKSGIAPGDELQLSQAIQSQAMNFAVAGGTANALTATLSPAPAALSPGLSIVLLVTTPNNGAATLNLNGLGAHPIVNLFGSALSGGELSGPIRFIFDGAAWWACITEARLSANTTYYVNASGGSDSNSGLSPAAAFATIQKAVDLVSKINLNGFNVTISVADGTYGGVMSRPLTGSGTVTITGNLGSPQNVQVNGAAGKNGFFITHGGYTVQGFSALGNGSGVHNIAVGSATVTIGTMYHRAAPANAAQIFAGVGGGISLTGTHYIAGAAPTGHLFASSGGSIQSALASLPIMNFVAVANMTAGLVIATTSSVISAIYSSFINPGNATGKKFTVNSNGVINVNGLGEDYYPGATAGTKDTGGQVV